MDVNALAIMITTATALLARSDQFHSVMFPGDINLLMELELQAEKKIFEMYKLKDVPIGWKYKIPFLDIWLVRTVGQNFADPEIFVDAVEA
jgi:hypothetical protein